MWRILLYLFLMVSNISILQAQNQSLPLWPGGIPNSRPGEEVERADTTDIVRISKVQQPDIAVFLPAKKNATGEAVVICPGGGYRILAYDWEGTDIAKYFNARGVAAVVLKYRLPEPASNVVPHLSPLMDAKRALRLTRYHAAEWHIDPAKVGVMGFSAGGHLASTLGTHFDAGDSTAVDPVERLSSRPDFMMLVYPVITFTDSCMHRGSRTALLGENPDPELVRYYSNELQVTADTPPTILIHASDDKGVPVRNSLLFYQELVAKGVPASLHVYPIGGHGFSLGIGNSPLDTWPEQCIEWLRWLFKN